MKRKKDRIEELLREFFKGEGKPIAEDEVRDERSSFMAEPSLFARIPRLKVSENFAPSMEEAAAIGKKEKCPSLELLADFIEGLINKEKTEWLKKHIFSCRDCSEKYKTALDAIERHSQGKSDKTPEDISEETSSQLDELYRESQSPDKNVDDL